MKKLLAMFIVLCMLTPLCAIAEESTFTLRSGFHWGMTREEVSQLAEREGLVPDEDAILETYLNATVGGYAAEIIFMYTNKTLDLIEYTFAPADPNWDSDANKQMYNILIAGLTQTYGEPVDDGSGNEFGYITWITGDTCIHFTTIAEADSDSKVYCAIGYFYDPNLTATPEPTPEPTPTAAPIANDGF